MFDFSPCMKYCTLNYEELCKSITEDEAETVFDKENLSILTQLIAWENFIAFSHHESQTLYM
jgi:hypothetical protein